MSVAPDPEDHAPTLTATEARQAQRSPHLVWVLGISMAALIVGYVILHFVFSPGLAHSGGQTGVNAQTLQQAGGFQAPPPQPRESENPQTTPTLTPPGSGAKR